MSDGDEAAVDGTAPKRRQRKKRKAVVDEQDATTVDGATVASTATVGSVGTTAPPKESTQQQAPPVPLPKPRAVVTLPVQDIRDLVAGRSPSSSDSAVAPSSSSSKSTTFARTTTGPTAPSSAARASPLGEVDGDDDIDETDALQRLLRDARQMRDREGLSGDNNRNKDDEGFSIPKTAQSALSTLLTVDFFVVCAFLVWFLAGVFASYVLHDDAIQIAFNNLFTPVVQPALGLLMVGSLASAVFKEDDNEQN